MIRRKPSCCGLVRGSGTRGFAGIYPAVEDKIIRPLLGLTREEVLLYLKSTPESTTAPTRRTSTVDFCATRFGLDLLPPTAGVEPAHCASAQ